MVNTAKEFVSKLNKIPVLQNKGRWYWHLVLLDFPDYVHPNFPIPWLLLPNWLQGKPPLHWRRMRRRNLGQIFAVKVRIFNLQNHLMIIWKLATFKGNSELGKEYFVMSGQDVFSEAADLDKPSPSCLSEYFRVFLSSDFSQGPISLERFEFPRYFVWGGLSTAELSVVQPVHRALSLLWGH